jgi:hypothetical protein
MLASTTENENIGVCTFCYKRKIAPKDMLTTLPVWTDKNGKTCFDLPEQLKHLREGEKLLISPYLVYIPLLHLKKGQLACQGHVCCFPQDIPSFSKVLPRLPHDCHLLQVIKKYKDVCGDIQSKAFSIRKHKVLNALRWLKEFNLVFDDIHIDESNLSWMEGETEKCLPGKITEETVNEDNGIDNGPSIDYYRDKKANDVDNPHIVGMYNIGESVGLSQESQNVANTLQNSLSNSVDWPFVDQQAVNEYSDDDLFPKAFPWLFPGGVGDFNHFRKHKLDINDWINLLLRYEDGRFAKDKMWTFYVLNYRDRLKNKAKGSFYVKAFNNEPLKSLQDIADEMKRGNMSWLEKISYFNGQAKGSPGYWRTKRNEVNAWINHHINVGNGPPTLFITLSCAEYWWKDIKRLIADRFEIAGLLSPLDETNNVSLVNNYTFIVQEYFQLRVKYWIETVGKNIYNIKHYWGRFEFAPSRGQVHLHLLAICDFKSFYHYLHRYVPPLQKADVLAFWAKDYLGLSNEPDPVHITENDTHPSGLFYSDVQHHPSDLANLFSKCQTHHCSDYCMRKRNHTSSLEDNTSKLRRVCRFGAGTENNYLKCDTNGFRPRDKNCILRDIRGYSRLELARSIQNKRYLTSATYALQSWRANCDIQLLLYDSDPSNPDPSELATVTDYVVSYTCKGNESTLEEKQRHQEFISNLLSNNDNDLPSSTVATKIMNASIKMKIISKQEAVVLLSQMNLTICSESIETVSLSGNYRLEKNQYSNAFYNKYAKRTHHHDKTMDEFFTITKNSSPYTRKKNFIPYYVGGRMNPIWPPTLEFAKAMLLVYYPWHNVFHIEEKSIIPTLISLYSSTLCPTKLKLTIDREMIRTTSKAMLMKAAPSKYINYADFSISDKDPENEDLIELVSTIPTPNDADDMQYPHRGFDYDWTTSKFPLPKSLYSELDTWLQRIAENTNQHSNESGLQIPIRYDGSTYSLSQAKDDQANILCYIISFLKHCFRPAIQSCDPISPIRMTISGVAGSGKSTFIHTLSTVIKNIFQYSESIRVTAPTGSAASNVNGATCHHAAKIGILKSMDGHISEKTLRLLKKEYKNVVCFVIDERSLLSSKLLAKIEYNIRHAVNNGLNKEHSWGNIPIVIIIGDDFQLPPIESGAFQIFNQHSKTPDIATQIGQKLFLELADNTMFLDSSKRVLPSQHKLREILQKTRGDNNVSFFYR